MKCLFIFCSALITPFCSATPSIESRQTSADVMTSGPYSIQGCGSNASQIAAVIESMRAFLQPSLIDVTSTPTSDAYHTFFKDVNNAPFIARILNNIASGTPVVPGLAQPGFRKKTSPVIACLPETPFLRPDPALVGLTPWVQAFAKRDCEDRGKTTIALFIGGTNIVTLCPSWFESSQPMQPKSARPCIAVDRATNRFRGLGYPMARNLRSWMLHELVHVYLVAATNQRLVSSEVYTVNSCLELNAHRQMYMPNNYVYYASTRASKNYYIRRFVQLCGLSIVKPSSALTRLLRKHRFISSTEDSCAGADSTRPRLWWVLDKQRDWKYSTKAIHLYYRCGIP
ncbi:hypothetical protein BDR22DRAFT_818437 [Usnea florida]